MHIRAQRWINTVKAVLAPGGRDNDRSAIQPNGCNRAIDRRNPIFFQPIPILSIKLALACFRRDQRHIRRVAAQEHGFGNAAAVVADHGHPLVRDFIAVADRTIAD